MCPNTSRAIFCVWSRCYLQHIATASAGLFFQFDSSVSCCRMMLFQHLSHVSGLRGAEELPVLSTVHLTSSWQLDTTGCSSFVLSLLKTFKFLLYGGLDALIMVVYFQALLSWSSRAGGGNTTTMLLSTPFFYLSLALFQRTGSGSFEALWAVKYLMDGNV